MDTRIRLLSGRLFDVFNPRPEDFTIEDIAYGLASEPRFAGQTLYTYSVADHSLMVSALCPDYFKLEGLLHDGTEGLGLKDIPGPIKHTPDFIPYRELEHKNDHAIRFKFGLPTVKSTLIKAIDNYVQVLEQNYLQNQSFDTGVMPDGMDWNGWHDNGFKQRTREESAKAFLLEFYRLTSRFK